MAAMLLFASKIQRKIGIQPRDTLFCLLNYNIKRAHTEQFPLSEFESRARINLFFRISWILVLQTSLFCSLFSLFISAALQQRKPSEVSFFRSTITFTPNIRLEVNVDCADVISSNRNQICKYFRTWQRDLGKEK